MLTDALEVYVIGMFLICILLLLYFIGEYFKWYTQMFGMIFYGMNMHAIWNIKDTFRTEQGCSLLAGSREI